MNKCPTMENASENITKILNPSKEESDYDKAMRIKKEMSEFIGESK